MRRSVVVLLAVVASFVVLATPAAADTDVRSRGFVVTIEIAVDIFTAEDLTTSTTGEPLDEYWEGIVTRWWGSAFERLPYKNCYKLELDLDFRLRDINARPRDGRHRIYVGTETRGWRGVGWDGVPETRRDPRTGDGTRSYENDRRGDIPFNAPEMVVAHEFGHVMGLGDDRENGRATAGRNGTVMVGGAEGVDPYEPFDPAMIDKDLIDRLGRVIEEALKLEDKKLKPCETWNGTVTTAYNASIEGITCTAEETGPVALRVVGGEVSGTIEASGSETCTGPGGSITEPTAATISVAGDFDDGEFQLRYTEVTGTHALTPSCFTDPRFEIPVERGMGSTELTNNRVAGYNITCNIMIERQDDEPVG